MNIAVIDIGTNTFDLLISRVEHGQSPRELYNTKQSVRLGAGGIMHKILLDDAVQRGLDTLQKFKEIIDGFHCGHIYAFATSAVRDASNRQTFIEKVKNALGIDINVIDGDKEATYIYKGVRNALDLGSELSLIMDIGGGSIEFIIANQEGIFWEHSFNIGVARLLARFQPSDPILPEQLKEVEAHLEAELQPLAEAVSRFPFNTLIGSSGSFDTYAEMISHRFYSPDILNGKTEFTFVMREYKEIHELLVKSGIADRKQMKGIVEMRLDMIVIASIVTHFIIEKFNIRNMRLSTFSMKEGILSEVMQSI